MPKEMQIRRNEMTTANPYFIILALSYLKPFYLLVGVYIGVSQLTLTPLVELRELTQNHSLMVAAV